MKLFYDTETTGLIVKGVPLDDTKQPRLVQLACILTDDSFNEVSIVKLLIQPNGYSIPEQVIAVHGITTEQAMKAGVPMKVAMGIFGYLAFVADELLAFNDDYDKMVLTGESMRLKQNTPFGSRKTTCCMRPLVDVCKIPKPNPQPWHTDKYKWPKLIEAHRHAFGIDFEKAHDALADVRATIAVWKWYQAGGKEQPKEISETKL